MEQVVIEFVGDTTKLEPAIEVLRKAGAVSEKDAAAFKKLSSEGAKALGDVGKESKNTLKNLTDLEKGVQHLAKVMEEGFQEGMMEALDEAGVTMEEFQAAMQKAASGAKAFGAEEGKLEQKIESLNAELQKMKTNLAGSAESEELLRKELAQTNKELAKLKEAFEKLKNGTDGNEESTSSLKKQLKEMNAQLIVMKVNGQDNTAEYEELRLKAGELKDAIGDVSEAIARTGSDTGGLDNLIELAGGVAGGFAVAQGTMALFGEEGEEIQKTLLKVNAAMAILQGLQQIQAVLAKEQFKSLATLVGMQKVQALQTQLQTAAESKNIIVRYAAVAAQKALNTVMAANPLALALILVAAIAAAWSAFADDAETAEEAQARLNKEIENANQILDLNLQSIRNQGDVYAAELKKNGASESVINKARLEYLDREIKQRNENLEVARKVYNESLSQNKETLENATKNLDAQTAEYKDALNQRKIDAIDNDKVITEEGLKSARAFAEAKLLLTKANSRAELEAQKQVIRARLAEELKGASLSGERYKLQVAANKAIQDLDDQFQIKSLQNAQKAAEAKALAYKEGSRNELDFRLEALKLGHQADILDKKKTVEEIQLIDATYLKARNDLIKQYNRKVAEDTINQRLSEINAELAAYQGAGIDQDNKEMVRLKKASIDEQANLEIVAAQNTIHNAEVLASKLNEINKKADADKIAIDQAAATYTIDSNLSIANKTLELEKKKAEAVNNNIFAGVKNRKAANEEIKRINEQQFANEKNALEEKHTKGLISEKEYQDALLDLAIKKNDAEEQEDLKRAEKRKAIREAALNVIGEAIASQFQIEAQARQVQTDSALKKLQEQRDAELANKDLTERQKAEIDKRYKAKEAAIKRQAWIKDRDAKVKETIINGFVAIAKTFSAYGFTPAGAIAAAGQALSTAIQVREIKKQQVPAFKKGTKRAPKGYAWVGEEGPELTYLHGGEKIYTAGHSKKVDAAWRGGSLASADDIIASKIPKSNTEILNSIAYSKTEKFEIDYDKLGRQMAKHIPQPKTIQNNMDANGFTQFVLENGNRMKVKNQRYRF